MEIKSCTRRMSDSIEKRFCFDVTPKDRLAVSYTLQALSEEDRRLWLDAMDGREPVTLDYSPKIPVQPVNNDSLNARPEWPTFKMLIARSLVSPLVRRTPSPASRPSTRRRASTTSASSSSARASKSSRAEVSNDGSALRAFVNLASQGSRTK